MQQATPVHLPMILQNPTVNITDLSIHPPTHHHHDHPSEGSGGSVSGELERLPSLKMHKCTFHGMWSVDCQGFLGGPLQTVVVAVDDRSNRCSLAAANNLGWVVAVIIATPSLPSSTMFSTYQLQYGCSQFVNRHARSLAG